MAKTTVKKPEPKSNKPAAKGSKRESLSELFDNTDAKEADNNPPPGQHDMRLNSAEFVQGKREDTAVVIHYEIIDGENEGKKARASYRLTDEGGNKAPGMAYLKRDLAILGHEDVPFSKLEKTLEELTESQPMCVVNAVKNGQYTNCFLQGLVDGDAEPDKKQKDDDDASGEELAEGDSVTFTDDNGKERSGTLESIKGTKGVVKYKDDDDDDATVKIPLSDITKAEEAAEEDAVEEIEAGDSVTWKDGKKVLKGEVSKIKGDTAHIKDEDGDIIKVDVDKLTKVEEEKASEDIEVGDTVKFTDSDGKEWEGEVKSIKDDKAKIEYTDDDKDTVTAKVDVTDCEKV